MEKIFEIVFYKCLYFLNEAFDDVDKFNGGFVYDNRTSDNMLIFNGLIERQLALGKPLFVCFVDFAKVYDFNKYAHTVLQDNQTWLERESDRHNKEFI